MAIVDKDRWSLEIRYSEVLLNLNFMPKPFPILVNNGQLVGWLVGQLVGQAVTRRQTACIHVQTSFSRSFLSELVESFACIKASAISKYKEEVYLKSTFIYRFWEVAQNSRSNNSDIQEGRRSFSHLECTTHPHFSITDLQPIPQNAKLFQKCFYA